MGTEGLNDTRSYIFYRGKYIRVEDKILQNGNKSCDAKGYLHFHPAAELEISGNTVIVNRELKLQFNDAVDLKIMEYQYAEGFNKLKAAKKLVYSFKNEAEFLLNHFLLTKEFSTTARLERSRKARTDTKI